MLRFSLLTDALVSDISRGVLITLASVAQLFPEAKFCGRFVLLSQRGSRYEGQACPYKKPIFLATEIRLAAKIDFAATISSAKKGREPPPSAPRRSRKSSSSDKPRSSKKSSSSEKILKLMENLVKPLADGFESMRAQQKKTQEQATYHQELERMNRRLDEVDSKVHRATSSAPELTKALADTRRSPLTRRLRQIDYTKEFDSKSTLTPAKKTPRSG
ncbi:unnamed protein product [Microthlaspi erraticum]|uniref:Uncharacterized protein n=1 Tax=Microthlaspi erraticum TaxID=1685480 RepID=A0A6D2JPC3_9BRAS|nr:unnamed protein product [Microthlaspi erraticum]